MKYTKSLILLLFSSCVFVKMATFKEPKAEYFTYYKKGNKISAAGAKSNGVYFFSEFSEVAGRNLYGCYYLTDTGYMGIELFGGPDRETAMARAKSYMKEFPSKDGHPQWYGYYMLDDQRNFKATYVRILKEAGSKVDYYSEGHMSGDTLIISKETAYYTKDTFVKVLNRKCVFEPF